MSIRISNINPIQFWLFGELTFSQRIIAGVVNRCFTQLWQTGDVIGVQFVDDSTYSDYDLIGVDVDGVEVVNEAFSAVIGSTGRRQCLYEVPDTIEGDVLVFKIVDHSDHANIAAYSDPQNFEAAQINTQLIQFSNASLYDDFYFESAFGSTGVFSLRVEAKFFQEQEIETNESEPLSDGTVVKLSSSNKAQKYLEVEPAPFYFHRKIKRVLQCNTVSIDNKLWQKEGEYATTLMDERYPFYLGKSWLTDREGFLSNIVGAINTDAETVDEGDEYDYSEHPETYIGDSSQSNDSLTYIVPTDADLLRIVALFEADLTPFQNRGSGTSWFISFPGSAAIDPLSGPSDSKRLSLIDQVVFKSGVSYKISIPVPATGSGPYHIIGVLLNADYSVEHIVFDIVAESALVESAIFIPDSGIYRYFEIYFSGVFPDEYGIFAPLVLEELGVDDITYIGGSNDDNMKTYISNEVQNNSKTYISNPEDDDDSTTFIGTAEQRDSETYFRDADAEGISQTYFGEPINVDLGWGCIMDACKAYQNSLYWDDGDRVIWDDGDVVTNEH